MLKQHKVSGVSFNLDLESGLIYCYINNVKQLFAYSPDSCTAQMELSYVIKDSQITFNYYVPTCYGGFELEHITVDIIG